MNDVVDLCSPAAAGSGRRGRVKGGARHSPCPSRETVRNTTNEDGGNGDGVVPWPIHILAQQLCVAAWLIIAADARPLAIHSGRCGEP